MTSVRRQIKNVVGNYSDIQVKVREATSNDPWGPSGALMSEIADATYNNVAFQEIMALLWRRLNDHGKYWRHVYKALTVLEYIVRTGSEKVATHCRDQLFSIQTLKDFQFIDKDGKDQGVNVREKSKNLVSLLKDEERLQEERRKGLQAKERFAKVSGDASGSSGSTPKRRGSLGSSPVGRTSSGTSSASSPAPTSQSWQAPRKNEPADSELSRTAKPRDETEEALQLELAMALSREEAEKEKQLRAAEASALTEALSQSQAQASTDGASASPWGMSTSTAAAPSNDPWGQSTTATTSAADSDPWGGRSSTGATATAVPTSDPWGSDDRQQAASNASPWGTPAPAAVAATAPADPWGKTTNSDPFRPSAAQAPQNDAFGRKETFTPPSDFSSNSFSPRSSPADAATVQPIPPTDPFGLNSSTAGMAAMTLMQQPPEQPATVEKKFLGQNADLVNLDSLVGPPAAANPSPALANPFAMTAGTGIVRPMTSNPFQKDKPQAKSLNQIRSQVPVSGPTGELLPAPLIPDSSVRAAAPGSNIAPGPTIPPSGWGMQPNPMMASGMPPMAAQPMPMQPMLPTSGVGFGASAGAFGTAPPNSTNPFQQRW